MACAEKGKKSCRYIADRFKFKYVDTFIHYIESNMACQAKPCRARAMQCHIRFNIILESKCKNISLLGVALLALACL